MCRREENPSLLLLSLYRPTPHNSLAFSKTLSNISFRSTISILQTLASTMTRWLSPLISSTNAKNCKYLLNFLHWSSREDLESKFSLFWPNSQQKQWRKKTFLSKSLNIRTQLRMKHSLMSKEVKEPTIMMRWSTKLIWLIKMILMIRIILVLQLLMKINKSLFLLLIRMIGS